MSSTPSGSASPRWYTDWDVEEALRVLAAITAGLDDDAPAVAVKVVAAELERLRRQTNAQT